MVRWGNGKANVRAKHFSIFFRLNENENMGLTLISDIIFRFTGNINYLKNSWPTKSKLTVRE